MKTFVFVVGKLYITVSSDTESNAEIMAKMVASHRLGDRFTGKFNTVIELAAFNTCAVMAA